MKGNQIDVRPELDQCMVVGIIHPQCVSHLDEGGCFRDEFKMVIAHFASRDVGVGGLEEDLPKDISPLGWDRLLRWWR